VDDVTIFKGLADIGETDTIYDELSGMAGLERSPASVVGVKGAQLLDGLRGLFMRPQSPATPSLGEAEAMHQYDIKIIWKPGTPASIAKDVNRKSGSTRTTFTATWNSLLNYYRGDKIGKLHAQYIQSIIPYEDGKEMPYMRTEGNQLKATLKAPVSDPVKLVIAKPKTPVPSTDTGPVTPETQVTTPETIQTNPDVETKEYYRQSDADAAARAASPLNFLMEERIPGVPNYVPTALAVGGLLAAVVYIATRK
jgi:hypothetical protein